MYENLILPFTKEVDANTDFVLNPHPYFKGKEHIEGANATILYETFTKPAFVERSPRYHDGDMYLCILAGNLPYMFDWDAEIDLTIGLYGEDEEKYTITQPTIIRIPAGVWYCPLNIKKLNKPVLIQYILYDDEFVATFNSPTAQKMRMKYKEPGKWELIED